MVQALYFSPQLVAQQDYRVIGAVVEMLLPRSLAFAMQQPAPEALFLFVALGFSDSGCLVFNLVVALKQLYREVARREVLAHGRGGLYGVDKLTHGTLYVVSEVYMDVAHGVVAALIYLDHAVEEVGDSFARLGYDGHHRHTYHPAQSVVFELGTAGSQLIVHVEGYHHGVVHVDKLGGEEEIALQIG